MLSAFLQGALLLCLACSTFAQDTASHSVLIEVNETKGEFTPSTVRVLANWKIEFLWAQEDTCFPIHEVMSKFQLYVKCIIVQEALNCWQSQRSNASTGQMNARTGKSFFRSGHHEKRDT